MRDSTPICQNGTFFCYLAFKVYWCQAAAPTPLVNYEYFTSCPCILGNSQLIYLTIPTNLVDYSLVGCS
jgi:hypothetical protein